MTPTGLHVRELGVAFGDRVILSDVSFELAPTGMTLLLGPAGCGKSTLLRTLAGINAAHPALATWGEVRLDGQPLVLGAMQSSARAQRRPLLVMQGARFFLESVRENLVSALPNRSELDHQTQTALISHLLRVTGLPQLVSQLECDAVKLSLAEQRGLAIVRALAADPPVLFADEPTAGVDAGAAMQLIELLRAQSRRRAVVLVTHNQRLARAAGGTTLLLAGGRLQETTPTRGFFSRPTTQSGQQFVATGGCPTPSPATWLERGDDGSLTQASPARAVALRKRLTSAPRGFFWVEPGRLGGLPRPGIIHALHEDLMGLQQLRVSTLVTLEEDRPITAEMLAQFEIRSVHFPVVDMGVPEIESTTQLCRDVERWIEAGEVVAFHCRAGLGRTGTLLACQLIWSGASARGALDNVRTINRHCVQSEVQVDFLRAFENALKQHGQFGRTARASTARSQHFAPNDTTRRT